MYENPCLVTAQLHDKMNVNVKDILCLSLSGDGFKEYFLMESKDFTVHEVHIYALHIKSRLFVACVVE